MHEAGFEQEEGAANEATFSAQINADDAPDDKRVDYYEATQHPCGW
jgi:ATP-dependent helicase STH1/SNF2